MKKASWIVLLTLGLAMLALSLVSAVTAYTGNWAI